MAKPKDWGSSYFKDRVDPDDVDFRLVELRLPHEVNAQPNYGPFEYTGIGARERIRRFCAAYLAGTGDLSVKEADKIIRKSHAISDAKN